MRNGNKRLQARQLIQRAVTVVEAEREIIVGSFTVLGGRNKGRITDRVARRWLRSYDKFLRPARRYLCQAE